MAGEVDVKAQVRLQFSSVTGDSYVAIRTLRATQKVTVTLNRYFTMRLCLCCRQENLNRDH
jgi:hypothetical protein